MLAGCGDTEKVANEDARAPPTASVPYRLTRDETMLIGPRGRRIPVDRGAVTGFVDNAIPGEGVINITGWGAEANFDRPVETIVGLVGGIGVAQTRPKFKRPDVVDQYNAPGAAESGFALFVRVSDLDCEAPAGGLTVLGVTGNSATPLPMVGSSAQAIDSGC